MFNEVNKKGRQPTPEQFSRVLVQLPEFRDAKAEIAAILRSLSKKRLNEILVENYSWASVYERPLNEHIAIIFLALNQQDALHKIAQSDDPAESILDWADSADDMLDDSDYDGGYKGLFTEQDLIGLAHALQRTIISIMVHLKSLSGLVEDGRNGDDKAFFDAIRIDPTIVNCPSFADRFAKATLLNERRFLDHLRNALKGLSGRHWQSLQDVRMVIALLREAGMDSMSDRELESLFVDQLKIYPRSYNARKNLRQQIWKSRSIIPNGRLR